MCMEGTFSFTVIAVLKAVRQINGEGRLLEVLVAKLWFITTFLQL